MTEAWRLLDLGGLSPLRAQTLYEAVALSVGRGLVPNTLILCYPAKPYVCIGFHQELEKEIDVKFCREKRLPLIRRSQGGGAVYLDSGQQFYQVVARRNDPAVPAAVDGFFEKFLQPAIYTYRKLGLPAEYKPLNDIVVRNRKISGNGAGELDDSAILVGNIILSLDYDSMCHALKVPSEKFRDKLAKSMREWVTSLDRELGYTPRRSELKKHLIEVYKEIGIETLQGKLTDEEEEIFEKEAKPRHRSEEWLHLPQFRHPKLTDRRVVKVSSTAKVVEADYKAEKLVRVTAEIADNRIRDILISGDFFMMPENALPKLEEALRGKSLNKSLLLKEVREFYEKSGVQVPGVKPEDFVKAVMNANAEPRP